MRWALIFVFVLFCSSFAFAISGVSPASYDVDFEPNLEKEFVFDFVIDGIRVLDLKIEGNLAEYLETDFDRVAGRQKIKAKLSLPEELDSPGVNEVRLVAGEVVSVIRVMVPYPDKFIELSLSAPEVNVGEPVNIKLDVFNRGEPVDINPRLEIYRFINGSFEISNVISLDSSRVVDSQSFEEQIVPGKYSQGEYVVVAHVDYDGGFAEANNSFRVGEKRLEIVNYTDAVKQGRVNKFDIGVRSLWNDDLGSVYAEVKLLGTDYSFVTPSIPLKAWEETELLGFFDSRGMLSENRRLEVTVYFDGDSVTEITNLEIYEGVDFTLVFVFVGILCVVGFVVWMIFRFRNNIEKIEEKEEK